MSRKTASKKVAFLDRDGTLIFEPPATKQVDDLAKLKILPGVVAGLKRLAAADYTLIMVSNQDGLGTPLFPKQAFLRPQKKFLQLLKNEGIEFYRIFICPHFPEDKCLCRKPKTGLVQNWLQKEKINFEESFMLGDQESDLIFARNIGIRGWRMETNGTFPTKSTF